MSKRFNDVIADAFPEGLWFLLWYKDQQQWVPVRSTEYLQENQAYRVCGPFTGLEDALAAAASLPAAEEAAETPESGKNTRQTNARVNPSTHQEISFIAKRSRSLLDEINAINYRNTPPGNRRAGDRRQGERRRAPRETGATTYAEPAEAKRSGNDRRQPSERRKPVDEQLRVLVDEFHELMTKRTVLERDSETESGQSQ